MKEYLVSTPDGMISTIIKASGIEGARDKAVYFYKEVCDLDNNKYDFIVKMIYDTRSSAKQDFQNPRMANSNYLL
ncbi:MAG: hypothetical protein FWG10_14230 [Eubacteriaceae bacterium]|nr:hypothetical protein [Eubacteriaceae bacterium]